MRSRIEEQGLREMGREETIIVTKTTPMNHLVVEQYELFRKYIGV